jgi:hypothetical protein
MAGRGRGVTLKGAAAGAFINSMMGKEPKTDDDKHMRIATFVHMEMKVGNQDKAKLIIKSLCERGIDKTLEQMEGRG